MGGGSKKQKVGNRYFYGFVLVPFRQMDSLLGIRMSDKEIWNGNQGQGQIDISKPNAFGGDEREGGFSGLVDVQLGGNDQPVNDYLAGQTGALTSAMRGVVSLVFRRPYVSANTARLPTIKIKARNVEGIHRGWNVGLSQIDPDQRIINNAFYICFDGDRNGDLTAWTNSKSALSAFIRSMKGKGFPNSFYIRFPQFSGVQETQIINATSDEEYESLAAWVDARDRDLINSWENNINLSAAASFFEDHDGEQQLTFFQAILAKFKKQDTPERGKRVILVVNTAGLRDDTIYVTPFNAALSSLGNPQVICIGGAVNSGGGIVDTREDLLLLNNQQGVSTVADIPWMVSPEEGGSTTPVSDSVAHFSEPFLDWVDMNPAHIIRMFWTDPMRGGTVSDADIGDSFATAAQLFYDEGLGLSPKFRGIGQADADRKDVERHADCVSYRSNKTGKIELVPIRDDYDVNSLTVLDSSIVMDWSGLSRPRPSEIPNQLTVGWTRRDGEKGSVTRTNPAGVRRRGRVVKAQKVEYPAVTTENLAIRLCLRDLRTVSSDVLAGTIPLRYLPPDIECGSVVMINEPTLGFDNVVMRVSETRIGKSDDATAYITLSEDKFATTQVVEFPERTTVDPSLPVDMQYRLVTETSYYQGVFEIGQDAINGELEIEPDKGRVIATGAPQNNYQLDATLATNTGGGWIDQGLVDFEPFGVLVNDLSSDPTETTFLVYENESLEEINAGELARIGDEIIRIDDLVDQLDGTIEVTCGRGCLDGPPQQHLAGDVFILSSVVDPLPLDFIAGQSISVKMLSRTGSGAQTLSEAATDVVVFNSRAIRPYNVGKLQAAGSYFPTGTFTGTVVATWAHRDRQLQTTPAVDDYTAASIGPEAGTQYIPIRRFYAEWADVFELDGGGDVFGVADVFENPVAVSSQDYTALVANETTYDFTADDTANVFDGSDVFDTTDVFLNAFTDRTTRLGFGIRAERDGYENLHTPVVKVKPFLPPSNLTATQDGV